VDEKKGVEFPVSAKKAQKSVQVIGSKGDRSDGRWKSENGKWAGSIEEEVDAMEEGRGIVGRVWIGEFTRNGSTYYSICQLNYKVFQLSKMRIRSNGRGRERKHRGRVHW